METTNKAIAYILPDYFWEALIEIHREYHGPLHLEYMGLPPEEQKSHVFRAFQVMDCFIDVAIMDRLVPELTQ